MHIEGKKHKGYLKIREKLADLQQKRQEDRRRGLDKIHPLNRGSREAQKKEISRALAEEAKEHFYYSSKRWGVGSNMPKLNSIYDQARVKFADRVIYENSLNEGELPKMESTYTLGREWRYYKKDLDKARRIKKKADERAAERNKAPYGG